MDKSTNKVLGNLYPLPLRTFQTSAIWHTLHLPTNIFHYTLCCLDLYQNKSHISCGRPPGWETRLDGCTAKCSARMDGQQPESVASSEHKDGNPPIHALVTCRRCTDQCKSLSHWGNTLVSGRGLLTLSGKGLIHQIHLKTTDEYVVHPSNVIAYSVMQHPPQPYRFKSSSLRFQIPNPTTWLPDTRFWRTMRESTVWRFLRNMTFVLRTWTRRTVWGDRVRLS